MPFKRFFVIAILVLLGATFYSLISHEKYWVASGFVLGLLSLFFLHLSKANTIRKSYEEKDQEDPVERFVHMILCDAIIKNASKIKFNIKPKSFVVSFLLFNREKYPDATDLDIILNEDQYYWVEVMKPPMKLADRIFLYIKELFQYTIDDGQTTRQIKQPMIQATHVLKIDDKLTHMSTASNYLEIQEDGFNAILEQIETGATLEGEFCINVS